MGNDVSFSQQDLEAFTTALNVWAETLPKKQQALLEHLLFRSRESSGALSDEQLQGVVGGGNRVAYTPAQVQALIQHSDIVLQNVIIRPDI